MYSSARKRLEFCRYEFYVTAHIVGKKVILDIVFNVAFRTTCKMISEIESTATITSTKP
jgi:hypothetical protein